MVYKNVSSEWFQNIIKEADNVVEKFYKDSYEQLYDFILDYIKKTKAIMSNINYIETKKVQYDKVLQIYVLEPEKEANELFLKLCKKFDARFVFKTEFSNEHYSIDYKMKTCVRVSKINQYKNVSLIDFLSPIYIDNIYILPPILELIDIYKQLYNPENADQWESILEQAQYIQKITHKNIEKSIDSHKKGGKEKCVECKKKKKSDINMILKEFAREYKYLTLDDTNVVELISQNDIQTDFERINSYISKFDNIYLFFKKKNMFLAKDIRIVKHSFYIKTSKYDNSWSSVSKPILNIYNNLTYELVPYIEEGEIYRVHPWTQIRFYYIDLWNIFAAYHLKILTLEQLDTNYKKYLAKINKVKFDDPPKKYLGVHINELNYYKKLMISEGKSSKIFC